MGSRDAKGGSGEKMITEFVNRVLVAFPNEGEANSAIAFMQAKIKDSIGHWASVYDLVGCCSMTPDFAYRFTSEELNDWGWTSIDGYSLQKGPIRNTIILTMPPARKRGMINLKGPFIRAKFMDLTSLPITPPPEPYIPRDPIKMPTKDEIAASIKVYEDYDIIENAYKLCYTYKDQVTDHTFHQLHVVSRVDHILEDEARLEMWDKAWREELISAVMKAHEAKKKEQEKEKLKMHMENSEAVYEKMYKYATNFEIKSSPCCCSTATIECPVHNLNGLLGLEDDTAKQSKPVKVKSVEITNIEILNDRVVKVTFDDESFTKSVCQENDIFDLDVGITVCLMKKMLDDGKGNGTRIYNDIIRDAHKLINDKENEKIKKQMEEEKRKKKAHKAAMKRQAKKMKAKEEAIDIQKQAFIRAMQETGMVNDGK